MAMPSAKQVPARHVAAKAAAAVSSTARLRRCWCVAMASSCKWLAALAAATDTAVLVAGGGWGCGERF